VRTGAGRGMSAPDAPPGMVRPVAPSPTDTLVLEDAAVRARHRTAESRPCDRANDAPCPTAAPPRRPLPRGEQPNHHSPRVWVVAARPSSRRPARSRRC
jgi:hypothetical protein